MAAGTIDVSSTLRVPYTYTHMGYRGEFWCKLSVTLWSRVAWAHFPTWEVPGTGTLQPSGHLLSSKESLFPKHVLFNLSFEDSKAKSFSSIPGECWDPPA